MTGVQTCALPISVSDLMILIPSIQTEKIEGIKIIKSETVDAPQKIVILFQNEKST